MFVRARQFLCIASAAMLLAAGIPAHAFVFSGNDPMHSSIMTPVKDHGRFEGVGRIECRDPENPGILYLATGWVLGGADTVVTAAHAFFHNAQAVGADGAVDVSNCVFALYDDNQKKRETARIRYVRSPWMDRHTRNDSSYDVAVVKLERPVKVDHIPAVMAFSGTEKSLIDLVAFHTGIAEPNRAWITRGRLDDFPEAQHSNGSTGSRVTSARRLFSTSADSHPGSSGGMYYNERLHAAVGLHVGEMCDQIRPTYDPARCFNIGVRFTTTLIALIETVLHDQPQRAVYGKEQPQLGAYLSGSHPRDESQSLNSTHASTALSLATVPNLPL